MKKSHPVTAVIWNMQPESRTGLIFVYSVPWLAAVAGHRGQGTHLNTGLGFPHWKRVSLAQCSIHASTDQYRQGCWDFSFSSMHWPVSRSLVISMSSA